MEVRPGKFGDTFIFQETTGEEVGIGAGGQLKSLYTRSKLKIGCQYQIVFKGKVALKDGRTANDFDVGEYSDDSTPEYIEESEDQEEFEA